MRQDLEKHQRLLLTVLADNPQLSADQQRHKETRLNQRERLYRAAIRQAIQTPEESRRSFKSKQPGVLRKQLTNVLIDA